MAHDPDPRHTARLWEVIVGSTVGGTFLTIADLIFNKQDSITGKIYDFFAQRNFLELHPVLIETMAFVIMIGLGLGLCFVWQPKSRVAAFTRGSSPIAVLTAMNIGAGAVATAAGAEQITPVGTVQVSTERPRAFGPLGAGTLLTGESNARLNDLTFDGSTLVDCGETVTVGRESYCPVDVQALTPNVRDQLEQGTQKIWLKR